MEEETKKKIEEAVLAILDAADAEEMTEFKVRSMAADQLGVDLSSPDHKRFVRRVVESYLLSKQSHPHTDAPAAGSGDADDDNEGKPTAADADAGGGGEKEYDEEGDLIICRLSNQRRVTIQDFRGKTLVSIREYYERDGKQLPSAKGYEASGISLTAEQWEAFSKAVPAIEDAIKELEGK